LHPLFSSYPRSWAAAGLLVLRTAVAATAAREGWRLLADPAGDVLSRGLGIAASGLSLALTLGFLTPIAAGLIAMAAIAPTLHGGPALSSERTLAIVQLVVLCLAIALLGPGAVSLDARLFDRRTIVIPRSDSPSHGRDR
jgi:uncharacterized membrane protein YphA (DoxX/SURF4 family)